MKDKKFIAITGGGGFIGHHLAKKLSKTNNILVIDNFMRSVPRRLDGINVDIENCDIEDLNQLEDVFKKYNIESLFHLAAINGTDNFYNFPIKVMDIGISGCTNILRLSKKYDVQRLLIASSAEVYQTPKKIPTPEDIELVIPAVQNPRYSYALSKIYTEFYSYQFGIQNNMNISIFRPHNVFGPDMGYKHVIPEFIIGFVRAVKESKEFFELKPKGSLQSKRAFCYIDDIISGLEILLQKNCNTNVYNIGTSNIIEMNQILVHLAKKQISNVF